MLNATQNLFKPHRRQTAIAKPDEAPAATPTQPNSDQERRSPTAVISSRIYPTTTAARAYAADDRWSPDGTTIIFSDDSSLYRVNPDGSGMRQIPLQDVRTTSFAFDPGWSPGGRKIVFGMFTGATSTTRQEGIYTANADGTDVKQLTNTPTHDDSEDWGPHPIVNSP